VSAIQVLPLCSLSTTVHGQNTCALSCGGPALSVRSPDMFGVCVDGSSAMTTAPGSSAPPLGEPLPHPHHVAPLAATEPQRRALTWGSAVLATPGWPQAARNRITTGRPTTKSFLFAEVLFNLLDKISKRLLFSCIRLDLDFVLGLPLFLLGALPHHELPHFALRQNNLFLG